MPQYFINPPIFSKVVVPLLSCFENEINKDTRGIMHPSSFDRNNQNHAMINGKWNWNIDILSQILLDTRRSTGEDGKVHRKVYRHKEEFIVLFNAWCKGLFSSWAVLFQIPTIRINKYYILNWSIWFKLPIGPIGVFPKWIRNSLNSVNLGKLINHWNMNWTQFKDSVSHMCLAGTVVASWSPTEEVAGWQVWALLL